VALPSGFVVLLGGCAPGWALAHSLLRAASCFSLACSKRNSADPLLAADSRVCQVLVSRPVASKVVSTAEPPVPV
jgi:hypothetical protein